eukprot:14068649-Ditylum_brightwellii.AAC.1
MQLRINSNAAYLVLQGAKSHFASHFYLKSLLNSLNYNKVPSNAPIHSECWTIKLVVCSATMAKCSRLFYNSQTAIIIYHIIEEIGHPHQPMK